MPIEIEVVSRNAIAELTEKRDRLQQEFDAGGLTYQRMREIDRRINELNNLIDKLKE